MEFRVVIPARYQSQRFPGKVLVDINGKPMIQHVYERAVESGAESVVIATDDCRVQEVAEAFGATVCMTASDHESGTERLAEAVVALDYDDNDIVLNVQGDQPLIPSKAIQQVAQALDEHDNVKVASICYPIADVADLINPNVVKVVLNRRHFAMYFSRACIPWDRDKSASKAKLGLSGEHFAHVGLYAFRVGFLQEYLAWPASPLEEMEKLEQLRILWHGVRIHMCVSKQKLPPEVNTEQDLEQVLAYKKK